MRRRNREINVFSISALDLFASALGAFILISIVLMPFFLRVDRAVVEQLEVALEQASAERDTARQRLDQAQREFQQCQQRETACLQETEDLREEMEGLRGELARSQSAAEEAQREAERARSEAEQAEGEAEQAESELRQCRAELQTCEAKTFLAVVIQWTTYDHDVDLHIIDAARKEFSFENPTVPGRPGELSVDTRKGPGVEIWGVPEAPPGEYQVLYSFYAPYGNSNAAMVKGVVYFRDGHRELRERSLIELKRPNATLAAIVTVHDDGSVEVVEP